MRPLLSVVVIGRNEGARLECCLSSIKAITFPGGKPEVVYVDSASTDQSVEIARNHSAQVLILDSSRLTAARARNAGASQSAGEFILFLDGDTILDPAFVAAALKAFENPSLAVVWGCRREIYPGASAYNTVVDLDWISPPAASDYCGGDALMRRIAFEQADGYEVSLIAGEEPDLCCRLRHLGWKLLHLDIPMTRHDIDMRSFSQYWRRATRTGYAYAQVSGRFESSSIPLWSLESRRNRTRAIALALGSVLAVGATLRTRNAWPAAIALSMFGGLVARTAWKNRWKSASTGALILYGVHSHLQQIPIFLGQLQYRADLRRSLTRSLIEYKTSA